MFYKTKGLRRRSQLAGGIVAISFLLAATLSGCSNTGTGGGNEPSGGTAAPGAGAAAKLVPESYKNKTVKAVALQDYPPAGFMQDGKWVGYMVDLTNAIAADTGLHITIEPATFDDIIPGLQAARWDIGMPSFAVTDARRKIMDFISLGQYATGFILPSNSNKTISTGTDLCGLTAGVLQGSAQADHLATLSAECKKAGKPEIISQAYPSANQGMLALSSGRVEVFSVGSDTFPVLAPKGNGKFVVQPFLYESAPMGIGMPKKSPLTPAVLQAMKDLVADGRYQKILAKYGSEANQLTGPPELFQ
ncbi:ABC transporter substrate-binding protein [Arthrobacter sp. 2RAF6]|uniref:ABC transporter substrate-binding protein n=1 Tax=Arthrobacter sp. 2RAF6 TaxID=3233002 RepID=UPI003F8DBCB5